MSFAPETASFKSKMPKILNENDAPDGALINSPKQGTIAGQGDVGGKHVPIRGMVSTHTSNDDPLLDVSHPLGRLPSYETGDRKSTRLNSSHANISYAVFCL